MNEKMKLGYIIPILIFLFFVVSCDVNDNLQTKQDQSNDISKNEEKFTVSQINELYQKFHSMDLNEIDCSVPSFREIDLINFSFSPFNSEYSSYAKPTKWYPSLKKGQISWFSGNLKNVGCTEIGLAYFSVIIYDDKIIYSSPILELDPNLSYDKYLPQQEKSVLFSPVASKYTAEVFEITKEGNYTIFIFLKNKNTGNIVGIEKYDINTLKWM